MTIQKYQIVLVLAVLLVGTLFFLGKISITLNPFVRQFYLAKYLQTLQSDKRIDVEKFWEFRDFYSATTSTFKYENIEKNKPFLVISSSRLQSLDFLAEPGSPLIKKFVIPNNTTPLHQSQNEIVYRDGKKVIVRFVKEIPEMQKANSFFSYFGVELKPYSGYLWYNETIIYR